MPSRRVRDLADRRLRQEAASLRATLEAFRGRHGFGRSIAAPQIGVNRRFLAVNLGRGPFMMFNPAIVRKGRQRLTMWDDCMSFPDLMVRLERHRSIDLQFTASNGKKVLWKNLPESLAELFQHEVDHLDGILAVDRAADARSLMTREVYDRGGPETSRRVSYRIPDLGDARAQAPLRRVADETVALAALEKRRPA